MIRLAQRIQPLQTNVFADMDGAKAAAIASGQSLIDLSLGSTDLYPPAAAIATLHKALDDPETYSYTLFHSTHFFRAACARWYERKFGLAVDAETEVLTLIGSQEGTAHLPLALMDPGSIALLTDPGYPSYVGGVYLAGGEIHSMPLVADRNFLPNFDDIPARVCDRARLMVLSYPNNPTTAVAPPNFWQQAVHFCQAHNIALIHDFPYVDMALDGPPPTSVLTVDREKSVSVELFSMSKSFHMGGFRVGFAIGNAEIVRALRQVKAAIDFNQYRGILRAAAAVLDNPGDVVETSREIYRERRDRSTAALAAIGWSIPTPSMGMYLWAPLPPRYPGNSMRFCLDLVKTTGVALAPGRGFGEMGEGYIRFALMHEMEILEKAIGKISEFLQQYARG
ncbi:LL-diaminopimelate aminotransferase [Synechococcus sp. PCC 7336]|uniref:LL-diaminopimelate aminotransferase n=1 Tax=Synechococcus sp. PCC 7336 TaxID=195250 RepID=UPI00034BCE5D|nr:LL-diaminopimelate aminotransferase [Synechococcus sp. PCC 7336]